MSSRPKELSVHERVSQWLVEAGLYQPLRLTHEEVNSLGDELSHRRGFRIDCYCPRCHSPSVFSHQVDGAKLSNLGVSISRRKIGDSQSVLQWVQSQLSDLVFHCARETSHTLRVIMIAQWTKEGDNDLLKVIKIGQIPSKFDLLRDELMRYSKVADEVDLRELRSAAMCHSHGLHVGAFAYLRRVFERRLEIAHERARKDPSWDEGSYDPWAMRMDDRIAALANHLPRFLVDNRALYKILSGGIHELTEEECEAGYSAVEDAIGLILDEEVEQRERSRRIARATASLGRLNEKHDGRT